METTKSKKKDTQTASTEAGTTAEATTTTAPPDTSAADTATAAPTPEPEAKRATWAYIGATLPDGSLQKNAVFVGTRAEIEERFVVQINAYPKLQLLIVPVEKLAESAAKLRTGDNALAKANAAVSQQIVDNLRKGV